MLNTGCRMRASRGYWVPIEIFVYFRRCAGPVTTIVPLLIVAVLASGCGDGRYGGLRPFEGRMPDLRDNSVAEGYLYYRAPNVERANAVIAVDKRFSLQTSAWSEIPFLAGRRNWRVYVGSMGSPPKTLEIRGPDGEHIGIWYSVWSSTVVKLLDDRAVMVYPPDANSGPLRRDRD